MKNQIPNSLTCLNLFSGCLGVVYAFRGELTYASYAIIIAAIFDFSDGIMARILKAYSEFGKQLDSLADMVSFGLLPAVIVYQLFSKSMAATNSLNFIAFTAFLIAIFSAIRLAKFNLDTRQSAHFIGLATPANALLIGSLPMILADTHYGAITFYLVHPLFLVSLSICMSILLVIEWPLLSLKFKNLSISENLLRYILILSSILLLVIFGFIAIPMIMLLYLCLSIIEFKFMPSDILNRSEFDT